jgi:tRNA (adenine22-N1)-methyltransferase
MAAYVSAGERVADIGSDHGYLPVWLAREGISPFIVATDIAHGPLQAARGNTEQYESVECRLGDGLGPLSHGEVDTVVIAGMGGETIIDIMESDPAKTASFAKYVLQPRTKIAELRAWLSGRYRIVTEDEAEERGRLCRVMVVRTDSRD